MLWKSSWAFSWAWLLSDQLPSRRGGWLTSPSGILSLWWYPVTLILNFYWTTFKALPSTALQLASSSVNIITTPTPSPSPHPIYWMYLPNWSPQILNIIIQMIWQPNRQQITHCQHPLRWEWGADLSWAWVHITAWKYHKFGLCWIYFTRMWPARVNSISSRWLRIRSWQLLTSSTLWPTLSVAFLRGRGQERNSMEMDLRSCLWNHKTFLS